jgi:integration host factor subunit alpha
MTKAEIIERVYEKLGGSKQECARLVEQVFDLLKASLERGENAKLSGFGKFNVRTKKARPGRNPHTRQELTISPRTVVTFKASHVLREMVNRGEPAKS